MEMRNLKEINISQIIRQLLKELNFHGFLKNIIDTSQIFYDEPKFFSYSLQLKNIKYKQILKNQQFGAAGVSVISRELALLKCLSEAIERLSLFIFKKESFIVKSYKQIKEKALNPKQYVNDDYLEKKDFYWTKGYRLNDNKKIFIPAQLIYLGFKPKNEKILTWPISTGAAGGLTKNSAILRGIYEVIERDALMTIYLTRIKAPRIDPRSIDNKIIQFILDTLDRYQLKLFLFDITNDISIPTFLSILIDNSGLGPMMSVGYKSNIDPIKAVVGSIEESFMGRIAERYNVYIKKLNKFNLSKNKFLMLFKKIKYLIEQPAKKFIKIPSININEDEELNQVKKLLIRKKLQIYYADITLEIFRKFNHFVYKVIIPELQPYIPKNSSEIKINRLKSVASYFNIKKYIINSLPHPFL